MISNVMLWWHKRNLCHPDPEKICAAITGLLRVRNGQATNLVIDMLAHENPKVREAAARGLGIFGHSSAVKALIQQISQDKSAEVRRAAAAALGILGDKQAAPVLLKALGDPDGDVRRTAGVALSPLGESQWQDWVTGTNEDFENLGDCSDKKAVAPLIAAAKHPKLPVRLAVIKSMGRLGDRGAYLTLIQTLEDPESSLRLAAVEALAMLKDPMAFDPLVRMLKHRDPETRVMAAKSLGVLHDTRAIGPLHKSLEDPDENVCQAAVEALTHFGQTPAISRPNKQEVFAGRLGILDVPRIMSMVEPLRLTGALRVADGRMRIGHVHFINGAVRHADLHELEGAEALFALFHFQKGAFRFDLTPPTPNQSIEGNTMMLLLEGLRKKDEAQQLVDQKRAKTAESSAVMAATKSNGTIGSVQHVR